MSMSSLTATEFEAIAANAIARAAKGEYSHGHESDLVRIFLEAERCGRHDEMIQTTPRDTFVTEMAFRHGRADIVVFHDTGVATVIEAKDGSRGYNHVVSGVGQAGLYAVQLSMTKGSLKSIRKALLWSSTGDLSADVEIDMACREANVIPLAWPRMNVMMANLAAVRAHFGVTGI